MDALLEAPLPTVARSAPLDKELKTPLPTYDSLSGQITALFDLPSIKEKSRTISWGGERRTVLYSQLLVSGNDMIGITLQQKVDHHGYRVIVSKMIAPEIWSIRRLNLEDGKIEYQQYELNGTKDLPEARQNIESANDSRKALFKADFLLAQVKDVLKESG
jgi:hypothetical protein